MRIFLCGLVAAAMSYFVLSLNAQAPPQTKTVPPKTVTAQKTAPVAKSSPAKRGAPSAATKVVQAKQGTTTPAVSKTGARTTVAAKNNKKAPTKRAPAPTWRNRQLAPTPDRYKEIQQALASKGYLKPEDATGAWDQNSMEALKKFQADQKLESSGKVNSLSLIALGLGPKHTAGTVPPPEAPISPEAK